MLVSISVSVSVLVGVGRLTTMGRRRPAASIGAAGRAATGLVGRSNKRQWQKCGWKGSFPYRRSALILFSRLPIGDLLYFSRSPL